MPFRRDPRTGSESTRCLRNLRKNGMVLVGGEITTSAWVDIEETPVTPFAKLAMYIPTWALTLLLCGSERHR